MSQSFQREETQERRRKESGGEERRGEEKGAGRGPTGPRRGRRLRGVGRVKMGSLRLGKVKERKGVEISGWGGQSREKEPWRVGVEMSSFVCI